MLPCKFQTAKPGTLCEKVAGWFQEGLVGSNEDGTSVFTACCVAVVAPPQLFGDITNCKIYQRDF